MKAALIIIVVLSAALLLFFAVHDVISLGMGISGSATRAPKQFWDALMDAVIWCIEYKTGTFAVFIVCLAILYLIKDPTIKAR